MRGLLRIINVRTVLVAIAIVAALLAIDGGSVVLTRISSHDDLQQAGYEAAAVAKQGPTTRETALAALAAAEADADEHGISVTGHGFTIYPDGHVTLTGTKIAPTLLMRHLSMLAHLTRVSTTISVEPLPYGN